MEPEGSLPFSQEPAIGAYLETNSVHTLTTYFSNTHFNIILPSKHGFISLSIEGQSWDLMVCTGD
jgi:hypothetical protein